MTELTEDIEKAAGVLRGGGLVAFPTETVYGLGADAGDPAAVARVFAAKGRPPSHPLIVHFSDADAIGDWARDVPASVRLLAERFWPGPLTLVLRRGARVPLEVTGGLETVAVRVPDHPVALKLLSAFGGGIAAPSANRFGSVSPTTAEHVRTELDGAVDLILDGGACQVGVESTIVDATGPVPTVLRPGGVTREDLQDVLGHAVAVPESSKVRVPGSHPSHYAPRARVVLTEPGALVEEAASAARNGHKVGVLLPPGLDAGGVAPHEVGSAPHEVGSALHAVVPVPVAMDAYARGLYGFLRGFDEAGCDLILASLPQETGLGLAVANRLRRAAGPR